MKRKILIVEDEKSVAIYTKHITQQCGYQVTDVADSYDSVYNSIKSNPPEIILMDICLEEGKDGIEIASAISSEFDIPVIFVSALSDDLTIHRAKLVNPYGYLTKPVQSSDLKNAIEISLYKYEYEKKLRTLEKISMENEIELIRHQRLASLGVLSASIAHEIRQPLHVIKIISDSLIYQIEHNIEDSDTTISKIDSLQKISSSCDRISKIISEMQNMIKRTDKDDREIDLNIEIRKIVDLYSHKLNNRDIQFECNLEHLISKLKFSSVQFEQVITNLINNALDALGDSDKPDKFIKISTVQNADSIIISISDNGTGIKDEIRELIFDPMFTTKTTRDSMGLGLFVTASILESRKGTIKHFNNNYGGSTFEVLLKRN